MTNNRLKNQAWLKSVWLPTIFLTVSLLGGLRLDAETRAFLFVGPPLVTLVLAVLLTVLLIRGRLVVVNEWLSSEFTVGANISHSLTLLTLFFASAQAINAVLPEQGLLHWLFAFLFLWTLWNNQFSEFDARRLLRSLGVLFGTAFLLKHILLSALYSPGSNWLTRIAGAVLEGVSLGTLDAQVFAPATGYISFFALALYVLGLILLIPATSERADPKALQLLRALQELSSDDRVKIRRALSLDNEWQQSEEPPSLPEAVTAARLKPHTED